MTSAARLGGVQILRLYRDEADRVWVGGDGELGDSSRLSVAEFLRAAADVLPRVRTIRVIGDRWHAPLLCRLFEGQQLGGAYALWMLNPTHWRGSLRGTPSDALRFLWQPDIRAFGPGQQIKVDSAEYLAFSLAADGAAAPRGDLAWSIGREPMWAALSFMPCFDPERALRLIVRILEPRWYIDQAHPLRPARLYAYLGLTPANARAWYNLEPPGRGFLAFRDVVEAAGFDQQRRHGFIDQVFFAAEDQVVGLLAALRRYVLFVWLVWLGRVFRPSQEAVFLPERFFRDYPGLAQQYVEHCGNCR